MGPDEIQEEIDRLLKRAKNHTLGDRADKALEEVKTKRKELEAKCEKEKKKGKPPDLSGEY